MKLLVVSPTLRFGGTEKYALTIAAGARQRGWDVHVLMTPERLAMPPDPDLRALGLTPHPLRIGEGGDRHRGQRARFLRMLGKLRSLRPDIVHLNVPWPDTCFGMVMACGLLRVPTVVTSHLIPRPFHVTPKRLRGYNWARQRRQQWTAVSDYTARLLRESLGFPPDAVQRIYNGVPAAPPPEECRDPSGCRAAVRTELGIPTDSTILVTVGRLAPQKGLDRLIQAAPHIVRERPDVRFVLVGDGILREQLEQQAREYGVSGQICFAGQRSDVSRLLRASDLFVFPTLYEGFGLALVEAMAHGMGVVSTCSTNIPEIVTDHEHGLLCRADDSAALLESTRWALAHPEEMKEMGRRARARAADFTEERMVEQTLDVLERTARLPAKSSTP